jgi:hypothetical protein
VPFALRPRLLKRKFSNVSTCISPCRNRAFYDGGEDEEELRYFEPGITTDESTVNIYLDPTDNVFKCLKLSPGGKRFNTVVPRKKITVRFDELTDDTNYRCPEDEDQGPKGSPSLGRGGSGSMGGPICAVNRKKARSFCCRRRKEHKRRARIPRTHVVSNSVICRQSCRQQFCMSNKQPSQFATCLRNCGIPVFPASGCDTD